MRKEATERKFRMMKVHERERIRRDTAVRKAVRRIDEDVMEKFRAKEGR